ncbi:MAG: topoisomerase DNA-binding C4 zinc finger domain-containing protein [Candidatus Diapherotrites archaeon]
MNCGKCSNPATKMNKEGIPVCSRHLNAKISAPKCPECNLNMLIKKSKFGFFWGCMAFPMCNGTKKL